MIIRCVINLRHTEGDAPRQPSWIS